MENSRREANETIYPTASENENRKSVVEIFNSASKFYDVSLN